jgi:Methyltransferase domain
MGGFMNSVREHEISNVFKSLSDGTDKFQHGYAPVYASLQWQDITSIFEIGIDKGYSLLAWTQLFPHAQVYGIDTDPKVVRADILSHSRIHFEIGDVKTYETDKVFDVIIDDCLHDLDTISVSWYRFRNKFKMFYIIEDVRPEIMYQVYELLTSTNPDDQIIFWKTSNYKGDVSFKESDSHCYMVRR